MPGRSLSTEEVEVELERQLREEESSASSSSASSRSLRRTEYGDLSEEDAHLESQRQRRSEMRENLKELIYSFNSFSAVFWPVSITIILAGLAVVYVNDGLNGNGNGLTTLPTVVNEGDTGSGVEKAGAAILNALVIVGIITGVTFLMVALYYFNMIRVLIGWLLLSTGMLLFFTTSYLVSFAFDVYDIPFDAISFYIFFWNFAICGLLAIFYQKGMPVIVNQGYLVCVSVVMAWLLVKFLPEWTSWALLILLALYDLCAVLTPVGPLKCLIEISQSKDVGMPGLLYEANITNNHRVETESSQAANSASGDRRRSSGNGAGVAGPLGMFVFMAAPSREQDDDMETSRTPLPPPPSTAKPSMEGDGFGDRESIKLGLGDFVFYSVLVGRAALNGLSTFVAVYFVVVAGLAGTLFLLAVYHKALPALPISIFFGVFFYFVADVFISPMVNTLSLQYTPI